MINDHTCVIGITRLMGFFSGLRGGMGGLSSKRHNLFEKKFYDQVDLKLIKKKTSTLPSYARFLFCFFYFFHLSVYTLQCDLLSSTTSGCNLFKTVAKIK